MFILTIDDAMPTIFIETIVKSLTSKFDGIHFYRGELSFDIDGVKPDIFPFTALRLEDDGNISYFPINKENTITTDDYDQYYVSKNRQRMRPGKMLKYISDVMVEKIPGYNGIPPTVIEAVVTKLKFFVAEMNEKYTLSMVEGEKLPAIYYSRGYVHYPGSALDTSCMSIFTVTPDYFEIYAKNPTKVKCLVAKEKRGIVGRVLIWYCDNGMVLMDRPYYGTEEVLLLLRNTAIKNGWHYKANLSIKQRVLTIETGDNIWPVVTLGEWMFKKYPYMDTFHYLDIITGQLSVNPENIKSKGYILMDENGGKTKITTSQE